MKLNGRVWTLYPLNSMLNVYIELAKIIVSILHTNGRMTAGLIPVGCIEFIVPQFYIFLGTATIMGNLNARK